MVRDEADLLPRWLRYYGDQVGVDNLVVLDDNSRDGSTRDLPCPVHRLPPPPLKQRWGKMRNELVNGMARALLACYDVVIYTDVDEFLVPDPARFDGLLAYLDARSDRPVIAPVATNVLHHPRVEGAFEPGRPVLAQRRHVKFAPEMCKPQVKRVAAAWVPGFHGIGRRYEIDPDLWMFHLKFYDLDALRAVAARRYAAHTEQKRGAKVSAWSVPPQDLVRDLLSWVGDPEDGEVPDFNPGELALDSVVQQVDGGFRSRRRPKNAMESCPLRQVPRRFQDLI